MCETLSLFEEGLEPSVSSYSHDILSEMLDILMHHQGLSLHYVARLWYRYWLTTPLHLF